MTHVGSQIIYHKVKIYSVTVHIIGKLKVCNTHALFPLNIKGDLVYQH